MPARLPAESRDVLEELVRQRAHLPRPPPRAARARRVGRGPEARQRGAGGEWRCQPVRRRAHAIVAQGERAGVDGHGWSVAAGARAV